MAHLQLSQSGTLSLYREAALRKIWAALHDAPDDAAQEHDDDAQLHEELRVQQQSAAEEQMRLASAFCLPIGLAAMRIQASVPP